MNVPASAFDARGLTAQAPRGGHLGVLTRSGTVQAIPVGAVLAIIEDPTKPDAVWFVRLDEVSHTDIRGSCACGKEGCSRKVRFRAKWTGIHPIGEHPTLR